MMKFDWVGAARRIFATQSKPRALPTASPIVWSGFPSGVGASNIRLWQMPTARRASGSAQPIDPLAPGWLMMCGLRPMTGGRRRRFAAEVESTYAQVDGAREYLVDLVRVRTQRTEGANPFAGQQTNPVEIAAIGKHGEEPRFAPRVHASRAWNASPAI